MITVAYLLSKSQKTYYRGQMRLGTLMVGQDGNPDWRIMDALENEGYAVHDDGLISKDGEVPHPLYWFGPVPKPENYVLQKSRLTHTDLYAEGDNASSSAIEANLPRHAGMTVQ